MLLLSALITASTAYAAETFDGRAYFTGDLHAHTGASHDGGSTDLGVCDNGECGAVADLADAARSAHLDFVAVTDHVNGPMAQTPEAFRHVLEVSLAASSPDHGLVTIPAGEVWFRSPSGALGHKNIFLFGADDRLEGLVLDDLRFAGESAEIGGCDEIWAWVKGVRRSFGDVLLIPHHPGMGLQLGTDWSCHGVQGAQGFSPAVEVYSEHGNSMAVGDPYDRLWAGTRDNGTVEWALSPDGEGLQLGFVGGTDRHDTHPGAVCDLDTEMENHPYGGGLTIAVLDEGQPFTREALYDAIVRRQTYATTGPRVPAHIVYDVDGVVVGQMGGVAGVPGEGDVGIRLSVPAHYAADVTAVVLRGPMSQIELGRTEVGVWRATVGAGSLPEYLYAELHLAGGVADGGASCNDGGADDTERIWLSPTWFRVVADEGVDTGTDEEPVDEDPPEIALIGVDDEPRSTAADDEISSTGACSSAGSVGSWLVLPLVIIAVRRRAGQRPA